MSVYKGKGDPPVYISYSVFGAAYAWCLRGNWKRGSDVRFQWVHIKSPVGQKPKGQNPHGQKTHGQKPKHLTAKWSKVPGIPEGLDPLVDYSDATYISGTYRKVQRPPGPDGTVPPIRVRKTPPLFPSDLWNVNILTMPVCSCTNLCEVWNRGFRSLVGTSHPTIWKALEHIRFDHHNVKTAILLEARGQPPQKRVRKVTKHLQDRLFNLCQAYYNDDKTLIQTLKGIGHGIRWK